MIVDAASRRQAIPVVGEAVVKGTMIMDKVHIVRDAHMRSS